jgi:hypothetical protein
MRRAQHQSYSPNLAPCGFYFFGYVEQSLPGREFADREELLAAVTRIFPGVEKVT